MAVSKILVIDDSPTERTKMSQILTGAGYRVITANSGAEGVEKTKSESPDLIFLDVVMDDKNGFQACREIKKDAATKEIPVFLVSTKSEKVDHIYAKQVGAIELIAKPYEASDLLARISAL